MTMDCYCDYEPAEFSSRKAVTARNAHKCYECGRTIKAGEVYEYVAGKWDGYFGIFKTCQHCCDMREFVQNSVPCFCWAYGNVRNDIKDTVEDAYDRARSEVFGMRFRLGRIEVSRRKAAAS